MHTRRHRRHRFARKTKGKRSRSRRSRRGGGDAEQNNAIFNYYMKYPGS